MKRPLLLSLVLLGLLAPEAALAKKQPKQPPAAAEPAPPPVDPDAWRAKPPEAGPAAKWEAPTATVVTLANGIPVYVVENDALPLLSVRLVMNVARDANPAGKNGLASITANMLDEGTLTLSAEQIASKAASLGANLSVYAGDEGAGVALDALTGDSLAPSLDLLADVVLRPKFDAKVYTRVQNEVLAGLKKAKAEPRDVASRVFAAQMFGKTHPYGAPSVGDEVSVKAIKVTDVQAFYKKWWHAGNAAFVVSGAAKPDEVKALLDARFGEWKKGTATAVAVPAPAVPLQTRVVFVEQPGAVQSVLRVGTPGVARTSPEFMSANLAGTIFGGMFSSRLNMNLREEHGWSYGAYGGFTESRDHGLFVARTSVQADKTAPAVAEIVKELQAAMAKPPSDAEITMGKEYLIKSLPGNFETNSATVGSLSVIPAFGLGPDAWKKYSTELGAVTAPMVAQAGGKFFDPARMLIVVVGPRTAEAVAEDGTKSTVDVVQTLKDLGYELVEPK